MVTPRLPCLPQFLLSHGGDQSNAYTSEEHTVFHYNVGPDGMGDVGLCYHLSPES